MTDGQRWLHNPVGSLDLETTGLSVRSARIISFALLYLQPDGSLLGRSEYRVVNPGMQLSEEVYASHGINLQDVEHGLPHEEALYYLLRSLERMASWGIPVVVFNAPYDLSLLYAQTADLTLRWPDNLYVLDPLVMDRALYRFRPGARNLTRLSQLYRVPLVSAHRADADAIAAARLAYEIGRRHPPTGDSSLKALMLAQRYAHERWVLGHQRYLRSRGSSERVKQGWPILKEVLQ